MAVKNQETQFIRDCVKLWMDTDKGDHFISSDIVNYIFWNYVDLDDICLIKAVSNELLRLERNQMIKVVDRIMNENGRPSYVYSKKYCPVTLDILRWAKHFTKVECRKGETFIHFGSNSRVRIFPKYTINRVDVARLMVEHHIKKIQKSS